MKLAKNEMSKLINTHQNSPVVCVTTAKKLPCVFLRNVGEINK